MNNRDLQSLKRIRRELALEKLKNVGNTCRSTTIVSKKDKEKNAKYQRKNAHKFISYE